MSLRRLFPPPTHLKRARLGAEILKGDFNMNSKNEQNTSTVPNESRSDKGRSWMEKNGGLIVGFGVFGLLALVAVLMRLANS
jgi:hypothetical protein